VTATPLFLRSVRLPLVVAGSAVATSRELSLALFPHGGQAGARRNAWQAMAGNVPTARERREALEALRLAAATGHPAGSGRTADATD
jgi:hypothetical protein